MLLMNINDDLKYNYSQFTDVVIANIDRNVTSVYLAFDEDFQPFLAPHERWHFAAKKW